MENVFSDISQYRQDFDLAMRVIYVALSPQSASISFGMMAFNY